MILRNMKKAPEIGSVVWVVCTKDDEPGSSFVKSVKVGQVHRPCEDVDPSTALADFFGINDTRGNYYHFDAVFDTEARANRMAAAGIRLAIRRVEQRLRVNNKALKTLTFRLGKFVE